MVGFGSRHDLRLTTARQRQGPRGERAVFCPGYRSVSVALVVIDSRPALPVRPRDKCYAMLAMSICATCHERGHSGAVLPAGDMIVSINVVRAAAVTPHLAGNRYGGRPRWDATNGRRAQNA